MRTHFAVKPFMDTTAVAACGRGKRLQEDAFAVDCLNCKKSDAHIIALDEAINERHKRFMAQVPREIAEPWKSGNIVCQECEGRLFRVGVRTCYGHYQNYVCSNCAFQESRLTETGMSA